MQAVLLALLAAVAVGTIFLAFGGIGGLGPVLPGPVPPEAEKVVNRIKIEMGRVITWDSAPADIPVWLTGQPLEIEFIIRFQPNFVWVSRVEGSANWKMEIISSNQSGEISVLAKPIRLSSGIHRLLTLRLYRVEKASAELTIPKETVKARFPSDGPYEVEIISGAIGMPGIK